MYVHNDTSAAADGDAFWAARGDNELRFLHERGRARVLAGIVEIPHHFDASHGITSIKTGTVAQLVLPFVELEAGLMLSKTETVKGARGAPNGGGRGLGALPDRKKSPHAQKNHTQRTASPCR